MLSAHLNACVLTFLPVTAEPSLHPTSVVLSVWQRRGVTGMNEQSGCSRGCWPPLSVMGDTGHSLASPFCASVVPPAESLGPDERTLFREGLYKKLLSTTDQTWAVYRYLREDREEAEKSGLLFTAAWLGNEMAWWGGVFNIFQASPTPATSRAVCTGNPFNVTQ